KQEKPSIFGQCRRYPNRQHQVEEGEHCRENGKPRDNFVFPCNESQGAKGYEETKDDNAEHADCIQSECQIAHEEPFARQGSNDENIYQPFVNRICKSEAYCGKCC